MCFICALKGKDLHKLGISGYRSLTETIDAANSASTSYSLSTGESFYGSISSRGDKDWVSISLEAGDEYQFDLCSFVIPKRKPVGCILRPTYLFLI